MSSGSTIGYVLLTHIAQAKKVQSVDEIVLCTEELNDPARQHIVYLNQADADDSVKMLAIDERRLVYRCTVSLGQTFYGKSFEAKAGDIKKLITAECVRDWEAILRELRTQLAPKAEPETGAPKEALVVHGQSSDSLLSVTTAQLPVVKPAGSSGKRMGPVSSVKKPQIGRVTSVASVLREARNTVNLPQVGSGTAEGAFLMRPLIQAKSSILRLPLVSPSPLR